MEISVPLPLDQGFLRRECPHCERQFKWFNGSTDDRPADAIDPDVYFCPYCGEPAGRDSWWTPRQLEYSAAFAAGPIHDIVHDELSDALRGMDSGWLSFSVTKGDSPAAPAPLEEPHDMTAVEPPCHSYEPIKIVDDWTEPVHCLVCGQRFTF